jgi:hypothetical protein
MADIGGGYNALLEQLLQALQSGQITPARVQAIMQQGGGGGGGGGGFSAAADPVSAIAPAVQSVARPALGAPAAPAAPGGGGYQFSIGRQVY